VIIVISICILWQKIIFRHREMNSIENKSTFNDKVNYVLPHAIAGLGRELGR
jgi:hypothetical protein